MVSGLKAISTSALLLPLLIQLLSVTTSLPAEAAPGSAHRKRFLRKIEDRRSPGTKRRWTPSGPIVRTADGLIWGVSGREVNQYLGIPYAAPPVNNLRWRPPRAVTPWNGSVASALLRPGAGMPTTKKSKLNSPISLTRKMIVSGKSTSKCWPEKILLCAGPIQRERFCV